MSDGMDIKLKNMTYEEAFIFLDKSRDQKRDFLHLLLLQGQNNVSEVSQNL